MAIASRPNKVGSFLSRSRHSARPALESLEQRLAPAAYTVDRLTDIAGDGAGQFGSLRYCLTQANASSGVPDTITIAVTGTIHLSSELQIIDDVDIVGPGAATPGAKITIQRDSGSGKFRLLEIDNTTADLSYLELTGGNIDGYGGGIFNVAGALTVSNCNIHDNAANGVNLGGGGIYSSGMLTVTTSTIRANTADSGAGIFSTGAAGLTIRGSRIEANVAASYAAGVNVISTTTPVQVSDSLFIGNVASASGSVGGGLYVRDADAAITSTTFQDNQAGFGAGLLAESSGRDFAVNLFNTTFSGNHATQVGGALGTTANYHTITVDFYDCTVANNTSGIAVGGVFAYSLNGGSAKLNYQGSLFANNTGENFYGYPGTTFALTSWGNNLSTDGTGNLIQPGDLPNTPAFLGTLGDYGGPTPTIPLLPGSPALDAGVTIKTITIEKITITITNDQRGASRPQGSAPDIGAFEATPYAYGSSGDGQFTYTGIAFPSPLGLTISQGSLGVSGTPVTFAVTSGVATFSNGLATITVFTDASGNVSVPLTAGASAGSVSVRATVGATVGATYNESVAAAPQFVLSGSDEFTHVAETFSRNGSVTGGGGVPAYVDYGDGGGQQLISYDPETGNFTLSHAYSTEGSYHVNVTLRYGGNVLDQRSFDIDVLLVGVRTDQANKETILAGVVVAHEPGVTATLTHLVSNGSDASIIVAIVPTFVADGLNGSTQIGGNTITTAYDVRAANVNQLDSVTIVFHYLSNNFDPPVLRYYNRTTHREETVNSRLFVVDRFSRTITLILDRNSRPGIEDISGTVFTIAVPLSLSVSPVPVFDLFVIDGPRALDPTSAPLLQKVIQTVGGSGTAGSSGGSSGTGGGGGGGGLGSDGVAFALAQVTGHGAVLAFVTTTTLDAPSTGTLASLPTNASGGPLTAESSTVDKSGPLRDLPAVPDSLITLPGPILTPGSAEIVVPRESSDSPSDTVPPMISLLDAEFEVGEVPAHEASALDEVFVQLGEGRLRSRHDAWDEPQTDWRDMTLAVAAVLATRPTAPRRRRSASSGGR